MTRFTLGAHNLHDGGSNASRFADVVLFTEAPKSRAGRREMRRQMPDYKLYVCWRQRSLVIAVRKGGPFKPRPWKPKGFRRAHGGLRRVTPMRGTFRVVGTLSGSPAMAFVEHRINKTYDEGIHHLEFRRRMWAKHRQTTRALVWRFRSRGFKVFGGGDVNCSNRHKNNFANTAYDGFGFHEIGDALDRLGVDREFTIARSYYMSRNGSDHPRLVATLGDA